MFQTKQITKLNAIIVVSFYASKDSTLLTWAATFLLALAYLPLNFCSLSVSMQEVYSIQHKNKHLKQKNSNN